jgi:prophage regulatory protein
MALVGLSRSVIYDMRSAEKFPKPVKIGARAVGWLANEVAAWVAQRADRSRISAQPTGSELDSVNHSARHVSTSALGSSRRIPSIPPHQESAELRRLRALEVRVRQMHKLHAEIIALLGPLGRGE